MIVLFSEVIDIYMMYISTYTYIYIYIYIYILKLLSKTEKQVSFPIETFYKRV